MATTAVSVGAGLVRPMGSSLDDRAPAMAQEFYKRFGPRAHLSSFVDFARSNNLSNEETGRTQEILVNRLGIYGLAGRVVPAQEAINEKKRQTANDLPHDPLDLPSRIFRQIRYAPRTAHQKNRAGVSSGRLIGHGGAGHKVDHRHWHPDPDDTLQRNDFARTDRMLSRALPNISHAPSNLKVHAALHDKTPVTIRVSSAVKRSTATKRHRKKHKKHTEEFLGEGLGFADDADGRGGGVSGGSPFSELGRYGAEFVSPDVLARQKAASKARKQAKKLYKRNTSWGGPLGSQATQGANGVGNRGVVGGIRVPGGPIDTNEGGIVRVKVLSHSLVEVTVGGTATVHDWMVFPAAIAHRLSVAGRSTSRTWLPKINNWLHNESLPGDEVVVDVVNGLHFISKKDGFSHLGRAWGTSG